MNKRIRVLCLITALCLLLTGCGSDFKGWLQEVGLFSGFFPQDQTTFSEMTYTRPDMDDIQSVLAGACDAAVNATDLQQVLDGIYGFYDVYNRFYTNYNLAYIHYCQDMTDVFWEAEYALCATYASQLNAGLDELYRTLAASPWRGDLEDVNYFGPDFFDSYEGESGWTNTFIAMLKEETKLLSMYNSVLEESRSVQPYSEEFFSQYGARLEQIFVKLVAHRQKIAAYAGYESYVEYAYSGYARDYTPEQAIAYLQAVPDQLGGLYRKVNQSNLWDAYSRSCSEEETFAFGRSAAEAMGGRIRDAFDFMVTKEVYDIAHGSNKYSASFEVYLHSYYSPFLFLNPNDSPQDKLVFVHEFGHFANDYICGGSAAGTDVAEIHSQAMEYLSLLYGEGGQELEKLKMADTLSVYVEQSAYALFEHLVYDIAPEELSAQSVRALYESIGLEFGFDSWAWDSRDYVCVSHFFGNPMYMISYVASNDLALQIYQTELQQEGSGLALYERCLESQDSHLLTFAETYNLENPLELSRLPKVLKTLEDALA